MRYSSGSRAKHRREPPTRMTHAPGTFAASGSASSTPIGPASGRTVTAWKCPDRDHERLLAGRRRLRVGERAPRQCSHRRAGCSRAAQLGRNHARPEGRQCRRAPVAAGEPQHPVGGRPGHAQDRIVQGHLRQCRRGAAAPPAPPTLVAATTFASLPSATTDAAGSFRLVVKPTKRTTCKASLAGAGSEPTMSVTVKHLITLRALRRSGKVYLRSTRRPAPPRSVSSSSRGAAGLAGSPSPASGRPAVRPSSSSGRRRRLGRHSEPASALTATTSRT